VDAFELVLSNDHVAQGCSIFQDEHGTLVAYSISSVYFDTFLMLTYRYHHRCCRLDHDRTPDCPDQYCL
jgi:hypothetical protein